MNDFGIIALMVACVALALCLRKWGEVHLTMARRYSNMRARLASWSGRPPSRR